MALGRANRSFWIVFSGGVWFAAGIWLLSLGVNLIVKKNHLHGDDLGAIFSFFGKLAGGKEAGIFLFVLLALVIGFFKGRFVLSKTAKRVVARISSLKEPISLTSVYSRGYVLLLSSMIFLGISFKWLGLPLEVRGFVDVAIGSALINGAAFYFRAFSALGRRSYTKND